MSAPAPIPLTPFLTMESLLLGGVSVVPFAWPLTPFCTWALQKQELSEAPVRSVLCNRQGVHEFILLSCDVNTARGVVALWFRIERHPSSQGVGVLLNKSKPAVDTLKASTNLRALREPCEARDSFMYNPHDNPREVLKFKHIAEMCRYFTGHSCEYSLLGANCRWICYALLECLREAQPCYGGTWIPSLNGRPTADVRAAQLAKSHYLKDKHPTCCGSSYLVYPNFGAHVARATAGLASIAVVSSGQTIRNGGSRNAANPDVIYRTPHSLPESAVPHHQPPTPTTNSGPQPPSTNGVLSSNTDTVNAPESPLGTGATQPSRQQNDVSPLPVGDNITQYSQSPPISEDTSSSSHPQQRNTAPPVKHTVSQATEETTSHCSGCQCASHSGHRQNVSNDSQHGMAPSQSLLSNTRGEDTSGLASQLSSMNIQSDVPVAGFSHGQWVGESITTPKEPSPSEASAVRPCSCCGPQGNLPAQRPASAFVPAPAVSNETYNSLGAAYPTHPGRIHSGISQRSATSSTGVGSTHHNDMTPVTTHHPGDYGRYSTQTIPRSSLPPTHSSHTRRVSDGSNAFHAHQRLPQVSFPNSNPSVGGVTSSYTVNHNRTSTLGADHPSYDHRTSMHAQGCQHIHSHPPTGQIINVMGPVSHGYPFSHVDGAPRPRHTHEVPPSPLYAHPGIQENTHAYSNQSRNNTRDSYLAPGNCTHGPSPSLPRHPVNRNSMNQFQAFQNHTQVPQSPGYNSNTLGEHYHPTQHNLYRISEDAPQPGLENQWNLTDGSVGVDLSEYGLQSMLPNYTQPLPLSDPLTQLASDYSAQHPDAAFQQLYTSSGLPANSYSQVEPPNRQWTQEVWGDQEFAQPLRTDSPTQLEYPLNDTVYPIPQEPPILTRMPDPRDYMASTF